MLGRDGQTWHEQSSSRLRGRRLLASWGYEGVYRGGEDGADMGVTKRSGN
jgi:hypothetical protein